MFCSKCGTPAEGNFCANCGSALGGGTSPSADWSREIRYHVLLRQPEVRAIISRYAGFAPKSLTLEKFVQDVSIHGGLVGGVTAMSTVLVHRLYRHMSTPVKTRTETLPVLPAYVMVAVLCSFAQRGHKFVRAEQLQDGCTFDAMLKQTPLSMGGELTVGVRRDNGGSLVEAGVRIRGGKVDWSKRRRILDDLFADLQTIPSTFVPFGQQP